MRVADLPTDRAREVQKAIREETVKFLYVLSRTSNQREGPLLELKVAHDVRKKDKLHDFIIPLQTTGMLLLIAVVGAVVLAKRKV